MQDTYKQRALYYSLHSLYREDDIKHKINIKIDKNVIMKKLLSFFALLLCFNIMWGDENDNGHKYNYKTDILVTFYHDGGNANIYNYMGVPLKNIYIDGKNITPSDAKYSGSFDNTYCSLKKGYHTVIYELDPSGGTIITGRMFPDNIYELQLPECVYGITTMYDYQSSTNWDYKYAKCKSFSWYNNQPDFMNSFGYKIGDKFGAEAYEKNFYCFANSQFTWVDACDWSKRLQELGFNIQAIYDESNLPTGNKVRQISMSPQNPTMYVGDRKAISITFNDNYDCCPTDQRLSWKSSNEDIAKVSQDGIVTAKKPGSAAILVTALDGSNVKAINKIDVVSDDTPLYDYKNDVLIVYDVKDWKNVSLKSEYASSIYIDGNSCIDPSAEYMFSPRKHTVVFKGLNQKTFSLGQFINKDLGNITEVRIPQSIEEISREFGDETCKNLEKIYSYSLTAPTFKNLWEQESPFYKELGVNATKKSFYVMNNAEGYDTMPWDTLRVLNYNTYKLSENEANKVYLCKSINLETSVLSMTPGDSYVAQSHVLPEDAINKRLKWTSSNEDIATVSADGRITALGEGNTNIIAQTIDGSNLSEAITVSVKSSDVSIDYAPSTDIMLKCYVPETDKELYILTSDKSALSKWESADNTVASMYVDGKKVPFASKVSFDKVGVHTIILKLQDGFSEKYISDLNGDNSSVRLLEGHTPTKYSVNIGNNCCYCDRIYIYKALYPTWWNNNCGIRTFDKKIFVPKGCIGYEELKYNNPDFDLEFMDVPNPKTEDIKIEYAKTWINVGETVSPTVNFYPSTVENKKLTWQSSDSKIASVDENGIVTAVNAGTATITAKTTDGSNITKNIDFKIEGERIPITSIAINKSELRLEENQTEELKAKILPSNATDKSVLWESSDENIVFIDHNSGYLMALSEGKATIKVSTKDGSNLSATCDVTVNAPTNIYNATLNQVKVMMNGNKLTVKGLNSETPIIVVSAQGILIYKGKQHTCTLPAAGIYIVKANGKFMKVCVK